MKSRPFLMQWLVLLAMASPAIAYAGDAVSIRLEPAAAKTAVGVTVTVILTDISPKPIVLMAQDKRDAGEGSYMVDVRDAAGNPLPLTKYGRQIYGGGEIFVRGVYRPTIVQPGQTLTDTLRADKIYDMSQSATYAIVVVRKLDGETGPRYVYSNAISVTLSP